MSKKLLVALATVATLAGFGSLAGSSPAEAQPFFDGPPRHHHRPPPPPPPVWHAPRHHFAPRVYVAPVPLYTDECRLVRKRERVLTDWGWRWRWRTVRYCD